jgi:DNA-binding transcriptional LysR family regulator
MLRLEQRVVEDVKARTLCLGACSNVGIYVLPGLLRTFQERGGRAPQIMIGSNPEMVGRLQTHEADAALLEWWDERPGFTWRAWRTEALVVIVGPGHPLSRAASISRAELACLPLIGGEPGTGTGRLLRDYFGGTRVPDVTMQLASTEAVKRAVEAGLGASLVLACAVEQEVREGRLHALALRDQPLEKSLRLVWRNDLPASDPLIGFLEAHAG